LSQTKGNQSELLMKRSPAIILPIFMSLEEQIRFQILSSSFKLLFKALSSKFKTQPYLHWSTLE